MNVKFYLFHGIIGKIFLFNLKYHIFLSYICKTNIVNMWQILLFTIGFLALAILLLGVRVFFVKGGKFPSSHISDSKPLKDKGITCAVSTDARDRKGC